MIHHVVQFALRQRFLVLMLVVLVIIAGALSFQRMPVDAYPDLSPPLVEIITAVAWPRGRGNRAPGDAAPLKSKMNGMPHMVVVRSISLYGLSDVIMTLRGKHRTNTSRGRRRFRTTVQTCSLPSGV